ncbi:MAG: tyrosine-type recombinase/integrase [Proteobacteria bacterium]|nr:tyrosine-type recombinase/integrase [Pseudomonadota bacterium]
MPLTDTKLRALKPRDKPYSQSDGKGLHIEVMPGGKRVWRLRYRLAGRQEKVTLGEYPVYSLAQARQWLADCRTGIARGESPMRAKRAAREQTAGLATVETFAEQWFANVVCLNVKDPLNIRRVLDKDILPAIGNKKLGEVTALDVLGITDRIKNRGADQMALMTRNIIKRLYSYAIARHLAEVNPAALVEARYIATARSRDVSLSPEEIGKLLRAIYSSSMRRAHKLALHLLILCMVRKSELIDAQWSEIDFDAAQWRVPGERMKMGKPHIVYLSQQALAMFEELNVLSSGSVYVLPGRGSLRKPISKSTLNVAIRTLEIDIRDFVIHDFRRTASTQLHEAGFNSDWIEKSLAHEQGGVRGVYNKAEYADDRRSMLQWWAEFVDRQIEEGRTVIIGRFGKESRAG